MEIFDVVKKLEDSSSGLPSDEENKALKAQTVKIRLNLDVLTITIDEEIKQNAMIIFSFIVDQHY